MPDVPTEMVVKRTILLQLARAEVVVNVSPFVFPLRWGNHYSGTIRLDKSSRESSLSLSLTLTLGQPLVAGVFVGFLSESCS